MDKYFYKRWYASNENGRQIFYIDVFGDSNFELYFVESSLPDTIIARAEFIPIINQFCKVDIGISERSQIIESFIDRIQRIPDVEQFYFRESLLDNNGLYCESYIRTIDEIISNPTIKEMTPYSKYINELLFYEMAKEITNENEEHSSMPIEKCDFERQINGSINLQNAYLDVYSSGAKYFYRYEVIDILHLEYFYMEKNDKIIFLFFTKIIEN
jgi:hypothetical protein